MAKKNKTNCEKSLQTPPGKNKEKSLNQKKKKKKRRNESRHIYRYIYNALLFPFSGLVEEVPIQLGQ